jgi:hypothetical protein
MHDSQETMRTYLPGNAPSSCYATCLHGQPPRSPTRSARPRRPSRASCSANGQPAAAAYHHDDATYQAYAIVLLTATTTGIARIVVFIDPGLFTTFALPLTLTADQRGDG